MTANVLQVLPAFQSGGVERVTLETVQGLSHKFNFFIASYGGGYEKKLPSSISHIKAPLHTKNFFKAIKNISHLKKIILNHQISIIHARSRAPAWSAYFACKQLKLPFITTYHGVYNSTNSIKKFYNSIMAKGDRVIAISKYVEQHIINNYGSLNPQVHFIPEGIDTLNFDPSTISLDRIEKLKHSWRIEQNKKIFMLPGRLTRWKGQVVFLKALQYLRDKEGWQAVILGDDQGRTAFKQELIELSKGLPIHFIPSCDDMAAAYALSDLVLSCSTDPEAFGRVTAEALSMERPVIATNHGGSVELSDDGENALLLPFGDEKVLAQALEDFLFSKINFETKRKQARQYIVKKYSLTQMLNKTEELYNEVYKNIKYQ